MEITQITYNKRGQSISFFLLFTRSQKFKYFANHSVKKEDWVKMSAIFQYNRLIRCITSQ